MSITIKAVVPDEWHIHITKEGEKYRFMYTEVVSKPEDMSEDEFVEAVQTTVSVC